MNVRVRAIGVAVLLVAGLPRVARSQLEFEAPGPGDFSDRSLSWDYLLDPQPDSDPEEFLAHDPAPNAVGDLDGLWSSGNGSDAWDGSAPGDDETPDGFPAAPGGIGLVADGDVGAYLFEDVGDPTQDGFPDPSNRKLFLALNLEDAGIASAGRSVIDDGFTMRLRFRLTPPERQVDMPVRELNGYLGGFGGFGIFNLVHDNLNSGVGPVRQAIGIGVDVDFLDPESGLLRVGEGLNELYIRTEDPTEWIDLWLTVENEDPDTPEVLLTIYMNGSEDPVVELDDWIPSDHDGRSPGAANEFAMGFVATADDGSLEVDLVALFDGMVTPGDVAPPADGAGFLRGDVDANGTLELTDPIANLSFQFTGSFAPPCMDALDFDDNGVIEITDPIGNLTHQFAGGPGAPPPGSATCGPDPSDDPLDCASFAACAPR